MTNIFPQDTWTDVLRIWEGISFPLPYPSLPLDLSLPCNSHDPNSSVDGCCSNNATFSSENTFANTTEDLLCSNKITLASERIPALIVPCTTHIITQPTEAVATHTVTFSAPLPVFISRNGQSFDPNFIDNNTQSHDSDVQTHTGTDTLASPSHCTISNPESTLSEPLDSIGRNLNFNTETSTELLGDVDHIPRDTASTHHSLLANFKPASPLLNNINSHSNGPFSTTRIHSDSPRVNIPTPVNLTPRPISDAIDNTLLSPNNHVSTMCSVNVPASSLPVNAPPPSVKIPPVLKCVLLNTWSLQKHATEVADYILEQQLDILFLTETWLSPTSGPLLSLAVPDDYSIITRDREGGRGGGVAIIFHNRLQIREVSVESPDGSELLHCKLTVNSQTTWNFILLYRPPHRLPQFESQLLSLLMSLLKITSKFIVLGDFNYWLHDETDKLAGSLDSALLDLGFKQNIVTPTHREGHVLDWVCSLSIPVSSQTLSPCPWSDHFFVSFALSLPEKPVPSHPTFCAVAKRNYKKLTKDALAPSLASLSSNLHNCNTADDIATLYKTTLSAAVDQIAPIRMSKTRNVTKNNPWFTTALSQLRREKSKAFKCWQKTQSPNDKKLYLQTTSTYKQEITRCKKEYFNTRIINAKSNTKELFKIFHDLENPNVKPAVSINKDATWCASIQTALLSKVKKLRDDIHLRKLNTLVPPTLKPLISSTPIPYFSFSKVSEKEIAKIIESLKPTSCPGDPCPAVTIKECSQYLIQTITKFINASFESATVPNSIKEAWITPLLKKPSLDPLLATSYRPITNVPFLLKIIDRVAYLQIQEYLERHQLFGSRQSGFRKHHGTETALTDLKSTLLTNMDGGSVSLLMLLDLSAAFDLVDFDILVDRLTVSANFSLNAAQWVRSFLTDRTARVFHNSIAAEQAPLLCGVPQGSCLSPTLYNIFTKPLFNILDALHIPYTNYADDTQFILSLTGDHAADSLQINKVYDVVQGWMAHNGLALNDAKTELLIVGTRQRISSLPSEYASFTVAGCCLPVLHKVKTLGVVLDSTLSMAPQTSSIVSTSSYYIKLLRQVRPFLSQDNCAVLARAIVGAKIDYCGSLLHGVRNSNLTRLQTLQNSAVRVVCSLKRRDHVTEARRDLHWLPVKERLAFRMLTITHKCIFGSAPAYLKNRISLKTSVRSLRSNATHLLTVPRVKLVTAGGTSFDSLAPGLWNSLPARIRSLSELSAFKRALKTHLFT